MNKNIELKDNEYIINGVVHTDKEVIENMMLWAVNNFVFRNNDVYLPEIPKYPLNGEAMSQKYPDLDVINFKNKFGNYALKYLMYNIFISGYEAGMAKVENDNLKNMQNLVDEIVEDSEPIMNEPIVEEEYEEEEEELHEVEEEVEEEEESSFQEEEIIPELSKEEPKVERKKIKKEKKVIKEKELPSREDISYNSTDYPEKTYERYLCCVIENRLHKYGMSPNDIKLKGFPTYVLGEVLLEVENADTINADQEAIKRKFYDSLKLLHEDLTKDNTTV